MTGYARQEEIVDREYGGGAVSNNQAESLWDYPRPPRVEVFAGLIEIRHLKVDWKPGAGRSRGRYDYFMYFLVGFSSFKSWMQRPSSARLA